MTKSFYGEQSLTEELDYKTDAKSRARTAVFDKMYTWVLPPCPPSLPPLKYKQSSPLHSAALTALRHTLQSRWNLAQGACLE